MIVVKDERAGPLVWCAIVAATCLLLILLEHTMWLVVPFIFGIEPVNVAVRSVRLGPDWQATSFARSGGACAWATAGAATAINTMMDARRRTAKKQHSRVPLVAEYQVR